MKHTARHVSPEVFHLVNNLPHHTRSSTFLSWECSRFQCLLKPYCSLSTTYGTPAVVRQLIWTLLMNRRLFSMIALMICFRFRMYWCCFWGLGCIAALGSHREGKHYSRPLFYRSWMDPLILHVCRKKKINMNIFYLRLPDIIHVLLFSII